MSSYIVPMSPIRDDGADREAPSSIVNASQSLVRWHFMMGIVLVGIAFTLAWYVWLSLQWAEVMSLIRGDPVVVSGRGILVIVALSAALPLLNAAAFFRSGAALHRFSRSRLVSDLHPAMYRLRAVWRMLSLTLTLMIAGMATFLILAWQAQQR